MCRDVNACARVAFRDVLSAAIAYILTAELTDSASLMSLLAQGSLVAASQMLSSYTGDHACLAFV